jgi:hypothetical protein
MANKLALGFPKRGLLKRKPWKINEIRCGVTPVPNIYVMAPGTFIFIRTHRCNLVVRSFSMLFGREHVTVRTSGQKAAAIIRVSG